MKKLFLLLTVCMMMFSASLSYAAEKVVVFAAASTTNMLDEVLAMYNKAGGNAVASYGASGTLARQIDAGANAAIFISANQKWLDSLEKSNMIEKGTRKNLVANDLVLIGHKDSNITVNFTKSVDFASILKGEKFVIGEPKSVPAGEYAKQSLEKLNLWKNVEKNIVTVENVRVALSFVSRGEAPLGVVFGTDAIADKNVKVIAVFPENTHDDISYPIGMIKGNVTDEAKKLYDFLLSDKAKEVYKKYGFKVF